jgi:two-component system sensor histidine kinase MprB
VKLRTRVALAGGAVVVAALTLVGAVEYPAVDWELHGQLDASLATMAKQAPTTFHEYQQKLMMAGKQGPDPLQGNGWVVSLGSGSIQIVTDPLSGSGEESPDQKSASGDDRKRDDAKPDDAKLDDPKRAAGKEFGELTPRDVDVASGATGPYYGDVLFQGERFRTYTARMPGMANTIVRAAKPESDSASTMQRLLWLLIGLTPTAGLVAVLSARLLAGRVLRPVGVLTSAVERITATGDFTTPGTLSQAARGRDEVGRLARAFAAMTEALDGSVGEQRRLVADASHELRTPLTSLTTNL